MSSMKEKNDIGNCHIPTHHWVKFLPVSGIALALIGIGTSIGLGLLDKSQMIFSYHVSFMYALSILIGCTFFVLFQFSSRAGWSVVVRRLAENIMASFPIVIILFIPIVLSMHTLFHHWTDQEIVAKDRFLQIKKPYLNETFFYIRAAFYIFSWSTIGILFFKKSTLQDKVGDHNITRKLQSLSYPSLAIMALTTTFAAVDWIMSLDPHWYSTMFGVYYFAGSILSAYAILIATTYALKNVGVLSNVITIEHIHDLGKLMFGHVVFWSYIAFSQYFLIWYANIPEETIWFAHRMHNEWLYVSIGLAVCHFIIPFFFLLPRTIKRTRSLAFLGALWILVVHFIDMHWLIMPTHHKTFTPHILDLTTLLIPIGLILAIFGLLCKKNALIPMKDPRLPESVKFENI